MKTSPCAGTLSCSGATQIAETWNLAMFPDQVYQPMTVKVGDSLLLTWVNTHNVVVLPARAPGL